MRGLLRRPSLTRRITERAPRHSSGAQGSACQKLPHFPSGPLCSGHPGCSRKQDEPSHGLPGDIDPYAHPF